MSARAHVIMGTPSLHLRIAESDLIVRGQVIDPKARFASKDGSKIRALVEIQILETLKGSVGVDRIRFAQDGHDVARYRKGDEALFFLEPIADSRELNMLAVAGGPTHVSSQEHDEIFQLDGHAKPQREKVLLLATRSYVASETAATAAERVSLIRKATLALLASGDSELGAMGLASLVLSPNATLVTKSDLPGLEKLLADSGSSIGFRAGLLAELERRSLIDGPPHWLALLEGAGPTELPSAIRAAGANLSPPVIDFLIERLADAGGDTELSAEAALALGNSREARSTRALAGALGRDSPRIRNAAIRGLFLIGSAEAEHALAEAAKTHADPATRRRASAALRRSSSTE